MLNSNFVISSDSLKLDIISREKLNLDKARADLMQCQCDRDNSPMDVGLMRSEKEKIKLFLDASRIEEDIARQKSRIQWLDGGDKNSKYFHNSIKQRRNMKRIISLIRPDGSITTDEVDAKNEAIRFYQGLLGTAASNCYPGIQELRKIISKSLTPIQARALEAIPTDLDIKEALFGLHSNKAPGPDGYNAHFFKVTWNITGPSVIAAIKEFFTSGELLRETNATLIALIPKVPNPSSMGEFRPISCCNTIYKCISKLLAKRLQSSLPYLVDQAQSAFIKGRKISDNVLLAQDLMRDYYKPNGTPRASVKVDLMKAYDSVSWTFLFDLLETLGFPPKFTT